MLTNSSAHLNNCALPTDQNSNHHLATTEKNSSFRIFLDQYFEKKHILIFSGQKIMSNIRPRDVPVPVPDWVTGYQSDQLPSQTGSPLLENT